MGKSEGAPWLPTVIYERNPAVLLAVVGAVLAVLNGRWELPWYGGALFGGLAGLVIGLFASGIFLMIYRAVQHIKGKHN